MSTNDNIRRRALLGGTRNGEAHECMVEYEFPRSDVSSSSVNYKNFGSQNIVDINWPEGVKRITMYSFYNSGITADTINSMPSTVEYIDQYAFYSCIKISGAISLPTSLKVLGGYAFYSCSNITSITFQSSVVKLLGYSLGGLSKATTVNLPENGVLALGTYAFSGLKWLTNQANGDVYLGKNYIQYKGTMPSNTNLTLTAGTVSIGGSAFSSKTQLKSISIPNTVQFIGPQSFSGCTGLTSFTFPESLNKDLWASISYPYNLAGSGGNYLGATTNETYSPFYSSKCTGITTITWNAIDFDITNSSQLAQNYLGGGSYLPNVTTVNIGNNVQTIPNYFIYKFTKVTSITLPSSVTKIGNFAFAECTGLTSFTIPENVTRLGYSIFDCSDNITTINYNAISVTSVASFANSVFGQMLGLTTINIGSSVQVIPSCFLSDDQDLITSITIPSSVTTIQAYAFRYSYLTSIDLPSSVAYIGYYAFYNCNSLTSITVRATTPPTLSSGGNWFPATSQAYTIYVPSASVNAYKAASGWSNYSSKIQAIP